MIVISRNSHNNNHNDNINANNNDYDSSKNERPIEDLIGNP